MFRKLTKNASQEKGRRCGVCLFELVPKAKHLRVDLDYGYDLSNYTQDPRKIGVDDLQKSLERGCTKCSVLSQIVSTSGLTQPIETADWYPRLCDSKGGRLHLQSLDRVKDYEICLASEADVDDLAAVHTCLHRGNQLSYSTRDAEVLEQAAAWLSRCRSEHPDCRSTSAGFSPTRLLFFGEKGGKRLRLIKEPPASVAYAALSHRWSPATEKIRLLRSNLPPRTDDGIRISDLPEMVRGVIEVLRGFRIFYIWIDCLCIIQDDDEDWAREAGRMASIYANAELTIAATWCTDSGQSLFRNRGDDEYFPTDVTYVGDNPVFIREMLPHIFEGDEHPNAAEEWPLLSRGWVFQEQVLSRRMLHFTRQEVVWQCKTTRACECGSYIFDRDEQRGFTGPADAISRPWPDIIEQYSGRNFTFLKDKLPALAGIAGAVGQLKDWSYAAGVWVEDIESNFFWRADGPKTLPRAVETPLPSWSWASISSKVKFWSVSVDDVKFLKTDVQHRGNPYLGDVSPGASICIRGPIAPGRVYYGTGWTGVVRAAHLPPQMAAGFLGPKDLSEFPHFSDILYGVEVGGRLVTFVPDYTMDVKGPHHVSSGSAISLLVFGQSTMSNWYGHNSQRNRSLTLGSCLVLRCVNEEKHEFERIGYLEGWTAYNSLRLADVLRMAETREITMI